MSRNGANVLRLLPSPDAGLTTYEERYGLRHAPFGMSPDVRFAIMSEAFALTLDGTARALRRREGLIVITGDAGSGKSLLCRLLLQRLDADLSASMVLDPYVTFEELLLQVLSDVGALPNGALAYSKATRQQLLAIVKRFLGSVATNGGAVVIVIDEAHDLAPTVLQQLKLLSNLETDEAKLLQIVLVGQPRLEDVLAQPELEGIGQRVARRYALPPLTPPETGRYIERRLSTATRLNDEAAAGDGAAVDSTDVSVSVRFTPAAMRAISARSKGNPRAINLLCDRALEAAHEDAVLTIGTKYVRAAARHLDTQRHRRRAKTMLPAAAAALLLVGIPGGWFLARQAPTDRWWQLAAGAASAHPQSEATLDATTERPTAQPTIGTLPVDGSITILALSTAGETEAAQVASRLVAAGLPAFSRPGAAGYDIVVGPYASPAEAADAQRLLAAQGVEASRQVANAPSGDRRAAPGSSENPAIASLLVVPGRASLVFDMPGEPRRVLVNRTSDRTLEVEAGPLAEPLQAYHLIPTEGVHAVQSVSIESSSAVASGVIARARVTVPALTGENVRISGRRVYVDLTQPIAAPETALTAARVAVAAPETPSPENAGVTDSGPPLQTQPSPVAPSPTPANAPPRPVTYRDVMTTALERFEEIRPFLLSAAAEPEDQILAALATTLRALGASVRRMEVPPEARGAHDLFSLAVEQAGRAVDRDFPGDRLDQARQAVSQFGAARTQLEHAL